MVVGGVVGVVVGVVVVGGGGGVGSDKHGQMPLLLSAQVIYNSNELKPTIF